MSRFSISEHQKQAPTIHMAPLIDIVFLTLVFFMTLSVFYQLESEINISVPQAKSSQEITRGPGEVIINVTKEGKFIINQNELDFAQLTGMLKKVSNIFPNQPVIIRADKETYHKFVVEVLDSCAQAGIWDISFSTTSMEN